MINVGGIENYIYELSTYLTENSGRVIWLCYEKPEIADSFKPLMLSNKIERVPIKGTGIRWFSYEKFKVDSDEQVLILSFNPLNMAIAEKICKDYGNPKNITPLYLVANTTGNTYFLERNFGICKRYVFERMKQILLRWEKEGLIRFFAPLHINYLQNNYAITISNSDDKILRNVYGFPPFNASIAERRFEKKDFTIITVGRFDFPHKAYILGLVKSFGRLKSKYPQLKLTIIGYGPDKPVLINAISNLPKEFQQDVTLVGEVAPYKLKDYYDESSLNISVAGAVGQGAKHGLLSIPARNFCESECEVYGFLPESKDMTTSLKPGEIVDPFIEYVINMSKEEYVKYSYDSYLAIKNRDVDSVDPLYLFKSLTLVENPIHSQADICFLKRLSYIIRIINRIKLLF